MFRLEDELVLRVEQEAMIPRDVEKLQDALGPLSSAGVASQRAERGIA